MKAAPNCNSSRRAVLPGKPEVLILLHWHVCKNCGKPRVCDAKSCYLRYRSHARQWAWTCAGCNHGPDEPAVALPIAA